MGELRSASKGFFSSLLPFLIVFALGVAVGNYKIHSLFFHMASAFASESVDRVNPTKEWWRVW